MRLRFSQHSDNSFVAHLEQLLYYDFHGKAHKETHNSSVHLSGEMLAAMEMAGN